MTRFLKIFGDLFSRQRLENEFQRSRDAIFSIDLPTARQTVLASLFDSSRFMVKPADAGNLRIPTQAGPITVEFFGAFEEVTALYGDMHLGGATVGQSTIYPQLYRIGSDVEHSEVLIQVPEDIVYVADGTEPSYKDDWYPSIYHFILVNLVAIYDFDIATISRK